MSEIQQREKLDSYRRGLIDGLEKTAIRQQVYELDGLGWRLPDSAQPSSVSELAWLAELDVEYTQGFLEGARRIRAGKSQAVAMFKCDDLRGGGE